MNGEGIRHPAPGNMPKALFGHYRNWFSRLLIGPLGRWGWLPHSVEMLETRGAQRALRWKRSLMMSGLPTAILVNWSGGAAIQPLRSSSE